MNFHKSRYPDIEVLSSKHQQLSFLYLDALDRHADRVLLIDSNTGNQWTGTTIKNVALAVGAALVHEYNLKPGDVCGILYKNCDWTIVCYIAILFAGGIVAVHCDKDPYAEFKHSFGCVAPKLLFGSSRLHADMLQLRKDIGIDFGIVWMNNEANHELIDLSAVDQPLVKLEQLVAYSHRANIQTLPIECQPDQAATILYTSESTGQCKPVARSRRNEAYICVSLNKAQDLWTLDNNSVQAGHLTLAHGTGTFCVHQAIVNGSKLIIQEIYQADQFLANIEKYRITSIMLSSGRLQNLMLASEIVSKYDISSLNDAIVIGDLMVCVELVNQFMDTHPNCFVRQCYGLTETGLVSLVHRDKCRYETSGAGELLPSVKMRLVDLDDHQLEIDKRSVSGELIIYSPFISPGYFGGTYNNKADASFLADGGYISGDIASMSHDDQLQLRGRLSEVLSLDDGWKVCPEIIESVLMEHDWIKEVAVIGVPSKLLPGCHDPRAFVVLKNNHPNWVNKDNILSFVAARVSKAKRLHGGVVIINQFPRTAIGKINRKLLREWSLVTACFRS